MACTLLPEGREDGEKSYSSPLNIIMISRYFTFAFFVQLNYMFYGHSVQYQIPLGSQTSSNGRVSVAFFPA